MLNYAAWVSSGRVASCHGERCNVVMCHVALCCDDARCGVACVLTMRRVVSCYGVPVMVPMYDTYNISTSCINATHGIP